MDLTPKQQTSEAIRQAETILITTGQHPTIDQVAAVIGLTAILRKFGKKVSAVLSDGMPQSVSILDTAGVEKNLTGMRDFVLKLDVSKAEVDKLRYEVIDSKLNVFITPFKGGFAPSDVTFDYGESHFDFDLAIVLGVPTRARIDRVFEQNSTMFASIPVVNLDFHRSNENYGAVNLIEPNASSLCEMLVALAESLQGGIIDAEIATSLLMGIMGSTDRFTAAHTTSKSLTVAAQMMAAGARQQAVVKALYRDGRSGDGRPSNDNRPAGGDRGGRTEGGDRNRGENGQNSRIDNSNPRNDNRNDNAGSRTDNRNDNRNDNRGGRNDRPAPANDRSDRSTNERNASPARSRTEPSERLVTTPERETPIEPNVAPNSPVTSGIPTPPSDVQADVAPISPFVRADPSVEFEPILPSEHTSDERPERGAGGMLPIIEPSHIELSDPGEPAPVNQQMATDVPAMADFAAAAEILAQRDRDNNELGS